MRAETILQRLEATGIRMEPDFAVPVNGVAKPLPYMIIRSGENITGSDNGRALVAQTSWVAALFTANRDADLEMQIIRALAPVAAFTVERFPDGTPYQTNFEFTTRQALG